jgi:anti-anti-sigma factor
MNEPSFEIRESEGTVELRASGELTFIHENALRSNLLTLLRYGKSKNFKLNLRQTSSLDTSCLQLVHIFKRQLSAVNATLVIEMPEEPTLKLFLINNFFATSR